LSDDDHVSPPAAAGGRTRRLPPAGLHTRSESMTDPHQATHDPDALFKAYIKVFIALSVFTVVSFACNYLVYQGVLSHMTSAAIIMSVAIVKAGCVAYIFMHLNHDWKTVYCIMVPVLIMCVMLVIVLLPDGVLGWPSTP
jgi:caa(3)-type oxidase subunit IV